MGDTCVGPLYHAVIMKINSLSLQLRALEKSVSDSQVNDLYMISPDSEFNDVYYDRHFSIRYSDVLQAR